MRQRVAELVNGQSRSVDYNYDSLRRLTKEDISSGSTGPTGTVQYEPVPSSSYAGLDSVGNRRSRKVASSSTPTLMARGVTDLSGQTFNSRDLLNAGAGFTYDDNGNTSSDGTGATYSYDSENRLIGRSGGSLPNVTMAYDADGNRICKAAGGTVTYYLVDDRNPTGYAQVVQEYEDGESLVVYTCGLDLISQARWSWSPWTTNFYGYDGLGSVRYPRLLKVHHGPLHVRRVLELRELLCFAENTLRCI